MKCPGRPLCTLHIGSCEDEEESLSCQHPLSSSPQQHCVPQTQNEVVSGSCTGHSRAEC